MDNNYYLFFNDQQNGPYSIDEIKVRLENGSITCDTLYWQEGMADWEPLHVRFNNMLTVGKENINHTPPPLPSSWFKKLMPLTVVLALLIVMGIVA